MQKRKVETPLDNAKFDTRASLPKKPAAFGRSGERKDPFTAYERAVAHSGGRLGLAFRRPQTHKAGPFAAYERASIRKMISFLALLGGIRGIY